MGFGLSVTHGHSIRRLSVKYLMAIDRIKERITNLINTLKGYMAI